MILSEKRLAWMIAKAGGVAASWTIGGVEVNVTGALHRHQTERMREQGAIFAAEGVVEQPHLCLMVAASDVEGKPLPEKGTAIVVALDRGDALFRCTLCELGTDQSHYVISLNEEAQ